jgi:hypothetical protein
MLIGLYVCSIYMCDRFTCVIGLAYLSKFSWGALCGWAVARVTSQHPCALLITPPPLSLSLSLSLSRARARVFVCVCAYVLEWVCVRACVRLLPTVSSTTSCRKAAGIRADANHELCHIMLHGRKVFESTALSLVGCWLPWHHNGSGQSWKGSHTLAIGMPPGAHWPVLMHLMSVAQRPTCHRYSAQPSLSSSQPPLATCHRYSAQPSLSSSQPHLATCHRFSAQPSLSSSQPPLATCHLQVDGLAWGLTSLVNP